MKKTALIIVIILLALIPLTAPSVIGMQAEKQYQGFLSQMEGNGLKIVRNQYRRGWLQAKAETEFELALPQAAGAAAMAPQPLRFVLVHQILHGPLFPTQGLLMAGFLVDTAVLSADGSIFPADYPGRIRSRIELGGTSEAVIDLPKFERAAQPEQAGIRFNGARGKIRYGAGFEQVVANLEIPFVRFNNDQGAQLEISGASLTSDYRRSTTGIMLGDGRFNIDHISLQSPTEGAQMELQHLEVGLESTITNNLVEGLLSYKLDAIDIAGRRYGPARLDARMANIPAPALARLQQAMEEISTQPLLQEQQSVAAFGALINNGPALLAGDPKFSIEQLQVNTPDGAIKGHLQIQPIGLQWSEITNSAAILDKLNIEAAIQMPEKLFYTLFEQQAHQSAMAQIEQQRLLGAPMEEPDPSQIKAWAAAAAHQQIQGLLAQEILVREETQLATTVNLGNGLLSVNGKTVPVPLLAPSPQ